MQDLYHQQYDPGSLNPYDIVRTISITPRRLHQLGTIEVVHDGHVKLLVDPAGLVAFWGLGFLVGPANLFLDLARPATTGCGSWHVSYMAVMQTERLKVALVEGWYSSGAQHCGDKV